MIKFNKILENYFRENYSNLVKLVMNRARSKPNAEDVVMEAFTRALKYKDTFEGTHQTFDVWFKGIMFNCLKDHVSDLYKHGMGTDNDKNAIDSYKTNTDLFDLEKVKLLIKRELNDVSGDYRAEVVKAYFLDHLTPADIRQLYSVNSDFTKNTIKRFYHKLKDRGYV